jgi:enamine deaminase RidA (YjgF/YER057c/UK114 family)
MRAMDDAQVLQRIADAGEELPPVPVPVAAYVPVRVAAGLAFVAGQVPIVDGVLQQPGLLGREVSIEQGRAASRRAALQALAALHGELGSFDRIAQIAQVTVYVACTDDFTGHAQVANGASEFLIEALGDAGKHARAAVGMAALPLGSCVEVAVTAELAG